MDQFCNNFIYDDQKSHCGAKICWQSEKEEM